MPLERVRMLYFAIVSRASDETILTRKERAGDERGMVDFRRGEGIWFKYMSKGRPGF